MGCIWSDRILQIGAAFYWGMKLATNLPDLAQLLQTAFYTTFFFISPKHSPARDSFELLQVTYMNLSASKFQSLWSLQNSNT